MVLFQAVLEDSKLFKDSVNVINEIVKEGVFEISKSGIKLVAIDSSGVAMIIFQLLPSAFSQFTVSEDKLKIGLNIDQIKSITRRLTGGERIVLLLNDSQFVIEIVSEHKRRFSLPIVDVEADDLRVPDHLEFTASVELKSYALKESVEDAAVISDSMTFHVVNNTFKMISKGDNGELQIILDPNNADSLINLKASEETKAKYGLDYLNKIVKAEKLCDSLVLMFKSNYPLRLDYVSLDKIKISYILAPRVDND